MIFDARPCRGRTFATARSTASRVAGHEGRQEVSKDNAFGDKPLFATRIEKQKEFFAPVNSATVTKESPAATAIANGANDAVQVVYVCADYIAAFPILAMHWGALV